MLKVFWRDTDLNDLLNGSRILNYSYEQKQLEGLLYLNLLPIFDSICFKKGLKRIVGRCLAAKCPPNHSLTPPPQQDTGRKQNKKCVGQDKSSLMKKATHGNKSKAKKELFSISHQQAISSHFLGSRVSVALQDKDLNN